jgi:hypothetical protein
MNRAVQVAAAALAAGLAASACGSVRMGAAALAGGQRISSATLAAQVADLNAGYRADQGKIQLSYSRAQMPALVLGWLLRFRLRDELASHAGLHVTPGEAQHALADITASIKQQSPTATLALVAVANGLPPDLLPQLGRYQAIQTALLARLDGGKVPTAVAAQRALQTKFDRYQCLAAKRLNIEVNPQYGELDYSTFSVVPAQSALSAAGSPSASPSPTSKPQLRPSC